MQLYKQYEEKYTQLEDEEDNEPVAPERLMHKKRRDLDSSSSGEKGFNFHGILTSKYRARKRQRLNTTNYLNLLKLQALLSDLSSKYLLIVS